MTQILLYFGQRNQPFLVKWAIALPTTAMSRAVLFLVSIAGLQAQERFQIFNTDNGLPQNAVLGMRQTKDGYLWCTTYRGLVCFDGVQFRVFDQGNTPAIKSMTFATSGLFEDHSGGLWAGTWGGGVVHYQDGVFSALTKKNGLPDNTVLRVDEDPQGAIWFFTPAGLARFVNGHVQAVPLVNGDSLEPYVRSAFNFGISHYLFGLWRFQGHKMQRFAYGKWSDLPLPADVTNSGTVRFDSLLEDSQRRLWFNIAGFPGKSFCIQENRLLKFEEMPPGAFTNYQDRQGRLWITDFKGHTATWKNGRATPIDLSTAAAFRVLEDREGGIWLGTINGGLARSVNPTITTVRLPGGLDANTIGPITEGSNGDIWVGSYGLTRFHAGAFNTYLRPAVSRILQKPLALWVDRGGAVYCGYSDGLKIFKNGQFQEPEGPLRSIKSEVHAIFADSAGNLWVGSETGLFRYSNSTLTRFYDGNSPVRSGIRAFHQDQAGTLWVGTDEVLCRYTGTFSCFGAKDEASSWRVRSITSDKDKVVWAAVAGRGVLRVAGTKLSWFGATEGLYTSDATAIVEDDAGYFWITCQLGVYRVRKQELSALAEGRIDHVNNTYFGKLDGLDTANSTGQGHPHGFRAPDGDIWFPTQAGLARIDPKSVPFNSSPPPVEIESCSADQRPLNCSQPITLAPNVNNLEISYTGLSLNRSNQIHFRYRLEGLDDNWTNVGTRRTAYFTHLPPGSYQFKVTGENSDGVWNQEGKELSIVVQPHFYQSRWFQVWVATGLAGLFILAWRARANQFEKRQALQRAFSQQVIQSQEAERKRIAAELHDSLGQRLALIKNMALLVSRSGSGEQGKSADFLQTIAGEASQAIGEVRQIAYDLRPHQLDLLGLSKAIEVLAVRVCQAAVIRADVNIDDLSGAFPKHSEIHVYRIVQECLNNVVKHSQAKNVLVMARRTETTVFLSVKDDGIGFMQSQSERNANGGGFGLLGLRERAELLRGSLTVRSTPGAGTIATIEFLLDGVAC